MFTGSNEVPKGRAIGLIAASGALYALSWVLLADAAYYAARLSDGPDFTFRQLSPGLVASVAFIILVFVNPNQIGGDDDGSYSMMGGSDPATANKNRGVFFFATMLYFVSIGLSIWFLVADFKHNQWPGLALLFQIILCIGSSACFVMSKKVPSEGF